MALIYTTSPNGLFIQVGKCAKYYNQFLSDAASLDTYSAALLNVFQAMTIGLPDIMVEGVATSFQDYKNSNISRRATVKALALVRLRDPVSVLNEIGATNNGSDEIFQKLIQQMKTDTATINKSTVTLGSVSAGASNVGNGTVLVSKLLDGFSSPGAGAVGTYPACRNYKGLDSELCVPSETMRLSVSADSFSDGMAEGGEVFSWSGLIMDSADGLNSEGSGDLGSIQPIHTSGRNVLANSDFETFTVTDTPDSWTIQTGTVGTHILEEPATADVYHGTKALAFVGDGSLAAIEIRQAIANNQVTANRLYCFSVRLKASATVAAGDVTIQLRGTGYTAGATEKITIAHGSLPTTYTLYSFFVIMPATIPSDFGIQILWNGTPTSAKKLWVDDIALAPASYGGGLAVAAVRGSAPFVRGDSYSFTVANDDAGVFQKFFRQTFGYQLPSSATPSIADSLAT